jgi:hypothetical protein
MPVPLNAATPRQMSAACAIITTYSLDHKQSIQTRAGDAETRKKLFETTRNLESYGVAATKTRRQETNKQQQQQESLNSVSVSSGAIGRCKVEMKAFRRQWRRTIRYKASILSFPATPPSPQLRVLRAPLPHLTVRSTRPRRTWSIRLVCPWSLTNLFARTPFIRLVAVVEPESTDRTVHQARRSRRT